MNSLATPHRAIPLRIAARPRSAALPSVALACEMADALAADDCDLVLRLDTEADGDANNAALGGPDLTES